MRDEFRIPFFCDNLSEVWINCFPDQRFGQFVINFLSWISKSKKMDPFYIEDDKIQEFLEEYSKMYKTVN